MSPVDAGNTCQTEAGIETTPSPPKDVSNGPVNGGISISGPMCVVSPNPEPETPSHTGGSPCGTGTVTSCGSSGFVRSEGRLSAQAVRIHGSASSAVRVLIVVPLFEP